MPFGHPKAERRSHRKCGPSKAHQEFKDSTNIQNIVRRFGETGVWDHVAPEKPLYGDFSAALDLTSAHELLQQATEHFMELDPRVREAAKNDPKVYYEMLATPEGVEALEAAGQPIDSSVPKPAPDDPPREEPAPGESSEAGGSAPTA